MGVSIPKQLARLAAKLAGLFLFNRDCVVYIRRRLHGAGPSFRGTFMETYSDIGSEEVLLNSDIPDDTLERAAGRSFDNPALTMNFCTYSYYQCGPI
jgi:hypothetical protein